MMMNFMNLRVLFLSALVIVGVLFIYEPRLDGSSPTVEPLETPVVIRKFFSEANPSDVWTVRSEWLCVAGIALVSLLLILVVAKMLHIRYVRRQMRRYADFLRGSYVDRPVDPLLYRKWSETVEAYNQSRSHWPFSLCWRAADAKSFPLREGPPPVAGLSSCNSPKTGVSPKGGMRKKKS